LEGERTVVELSSKFGVNPTMIHSWMRDALLNETMFRDMAHARSSIRAWAIDYNEERPHSALGYETPRAFAERQITATDSRAAPLESSAHLSVAPPAPVGTRPKGLRLQLDESSVAGQTDLPNCSIRADLH